MRTLLQQLKKLFYENPLLFFSVLLVVTLPLYAGEIVSNSHAYLLGRYINYLHVRISLSLILSSTVVYYYFRQQETSTLLKLFLSMIVAYFLISFYPIFMTSNEIGISYLPLYLSSSFHFLEFLIKTTALIIATKQLLSTTKETQKIFLVLLTPVLTAETILGVAQYVSGGPLFPTFLAWLGQPVEFTSKSILGIFEYSRVYGTTPHPNIFAGILVYFLTLILSMYGSKPQRILLFTVISLLLVGTLSKSGIIAAVLIVLVYLLKNKLPKISMNIATMGIVLVISAAIPAFLLFINSPSTFLSSRASILQLYVELLSLKPEFLITGTGFTMAIPNLLACARNLPTSLIWGNQILAEPPHNSLLLGVTELGVPLFVLLLTFIYKIAVTKFSEMKPWQVWAIFILLSTLGSVDHYLLY